MGLFLLTQTKAPASLPDAVFGGFGDARKFETHTGSLHVYGKRNGQLPQFFVRNETEFIACTGIFFYRQYHGVEALEQWLSDFDGRRMSWQDCHGHYALVVRRGERLWLATDAMGAYKVYHDRAQAFFSSGFSAVRAQLERISVDPQGLYEYVWNGATYGAKTFLREIAMLRKGGLYEINATGGLVEIDTPSMDFSLKFASIGEAADHYADRLGAQFHLYAKTGRVFRSALSGGYDSRLMLAASLNAGVVPDLYVYGENNDPDVVVAKAVAEAEGLPLQHVNKGSRPEDDVIARTERAWTCFDGWNNDGIFDSGADTADRDGRAADKAILFNGSVGEVMRNFFYLPDREYRLRDVVWSFYSRYDRRACTAEFDAVEYENVMVDEMAEAISCDPREKLARSQIEALYPWHRGHYWTGRDVALNQRFGDMLFPFMEWTFFDGTYALPVAWKNCGEFESLVIARLCPRLATYMSAYGFPPNASPTLSYRLKMSATLLRPPSLRRYSYPLQMRRMGGAVRPFYVGDAALAQVMKPGWEHTGKYFHPTAMFDAHAYNRLCTVEYLLQKQL